MRGGDNNVVGRRGPSKARARGKEGFIGWGKGHKKKGDKNGRVSHKLGSSETRGTRSYGVSSFNGGIHGKKPQNEKGLGARGEDGWVDRRIWPMGRAAEGAGSPFHHRKRTQGGFVQVRAEKKDGPGLGGVIGQGVKNQKVGEELSEIKKGNDKYLRVSSPSIQEGRGRY